MNKPESFEVTEYGKEQELLDAQISAIKQIVDRTKRANPAAGVTVSFTGNLMKLTYHAYEMHLPARIKDVEASAKKSLDDMVKQIKKEYKSLQGETLNPKEQKEKANYSVQKVSLNERYMYSAWRFYELG